MGMQTSYVICSNCSEVSLAEETHKRRVKPRFGVEPDEEQPLVDAVFCRKCSQCAAHKAEVCAICGVYDAERSNGAGVFAEHP